MTNQTPLPHAVELLPCPFCGSVSRQHDDECYFTALARLHAAPEGDVSGALEVMAGWNRRIAATPAQAAPEAQWGDARVQKVYEVLCSMEVPPADQHWEGWVARRIVDALTTPSQAVPSPSTADDERKAFEAWLGRESFTERSDSGKYVSAHVDAMWSAWQSRIALQKAKGPGMRTEASEAGQEPPTHAGSVAPGEGER